LKPKRKGKTIEPSNNAHKEKETPTKKRNTLKWKARTKRRKHNEREGIRGAQTISYNKEGLRIEERINKVKP